MTQQATEPLDAIAVPRGEGEARWWFGQLAVIKATGEATGGAYTLVEITVAPGYRTPLHVHHREDEGFWVLDGHATFTVGEETIEAPAGTYLFGPRDVPHWWAAGPDGARVLYLFTPAGIEGLIEDMSVPAQTLTPPPRDLAPPRNAPEIARQYGCEILPMRVDTPR
jgi:quercetin dioxygenase-like cupin family protein